MGEHQFALDAFPPWQTFPRDRIDYLRIEHVQSDKMQILRVLTLGGEVTHHIRAAVIGVARLESPGRLQARAKAVVVQPRFTAEKSQLQPKVPRRQIAEALFDDSFQHHRIGRRTGYGGDAKFPDRAYQQLAAADAKGDDGRAGHFQRRVIGKAAHPQLIVETVDDAMPRPQAGGALRAGSDDGRLLCAHDQVHGAASGTRRTVDANDRFFRCCQERPEGRYCGLAAL